MRVIRVWGGAGLWKALPVETISFGGDEDPCRVSELRVSQSGQALERAALDIMNCGEKKTRGKPENPSHRGIFGV